MKTLTEKQQRFLDVLFDEAGGDVVRAKELAGYSPNNSTTEIIKTIKEEIVEATAKDLLDRVGLVKTEKLQVEASNGLMILPPKDIDEREAS